MRSGTLRLLLAAAFIASVASLPNNWGGRRRGQGFVNHLYAAATSKADAVDAVSLKFDQKIDHFNGADARTFKQRYFYSDKFYDGKSSVNFLHLSGEQTDTGAPIIGNKPICDYARQYNATLYDLEHRFYGESRPFEDTSTEHLAYLSSRQAVEDIAEFIKAQNKKSASPAAQQWVVIGGSYAGNLAGWARLKHPELIVGAVASSAPLLAQLDFYGYLQTVDNNVAKIPECYNQLKDGIQKISDAFQTPAGRDMLDAKFPISPKLATYTDLKDTDIVQFFQWVTDAFEGASQYANPDTVENVCKEFTKNVGTAGYNVLDALSAMMTKYFTDDSTVPPTPFTFDVNYTAGVEYLEDISYGDNTDYTDRLWIYQTCKEFGYFQSTDRGSNLFQATVPMNIDLDMCEDLFGIDSEIVKQNIDDTNAYYGERDYYTGTNVVFAHGTVDPWTYLTKQMGTSQHWSVVVAEIEGGTHTSDLHAACDDNGANCNAARQQVQTLTLQNIDQWLNGPFSAPDSITISDNVGKRPAFYDAILPAPLSVRANGPKDTIVSNRAKRAVKKEQNAARESSRFFTGKSTEQLLPSPVEQGERQQLADKLTAKTNWISQPFDHFNPNDERQFKQKYFSQDVYVNTDKNGAKVTDAPNFLMIGFEGPESDVWLTTEGAAWMTYAKEVGANLYLLEHRYYGESKLGTNDLQYLTSAQMLYDVARFISSVNRTGQSGPWITFGLSYAGSLTAWSREWFPELILGAVGSSAPMVGKTDFFEYLQVVENVMRAKSDKCADRTQDAFDQLRQLTRDPAGRKQFSDMFNVDPAWSDKADEVIPQINIQTVFMSIYAQFQDVVQYSGANTKQGVAFTVEAMCDIMEDDVKYPNSVDAVRQVQIWASNSFDKNPVTDGDPISGINVLKDMLKYVDGHVDPAEGDSPRYQDHQLAGVLWAWQSCNEFGYFQTSDYGEGIFGNPMPVNYFVYECEQIFDVTMDHIEAGVARTNYQFGGKARYNTTNVVLPHGSHDPWHALGIITQGNTDASVIPLLIEGTAHCADVFVARPEDPPQLVEARKTILANIKKWLAGPTTLPPATSSTKTTTSAPTTSTTTPPSTPPSTSQKPTTPPTTTSAGHLSTLMAMVVPIVAVMFL